MKRDFYTRWLELERKRRNVERVREVKQAAVRQRAEVARHKEAILNGNLSSEDLRKELRLMELDAVKLGMQYEWLALRDLAKKQGTGGGRPRDEKLEQILAELDEAPRGNRSALAETLSRENNRDTQTVLREFYRRRRKLAK